MAKGNVVIDHHSCDWCASTLCLLYFCLSCRNRIDPHSSSCIDNHLFLLFPNALDEKLIQLEASESSESAPDVLVIGSPSAGSSSWSSFGVRMTFSIRV